MLATSTNTLLRIDGADELAEVGSGIGSTEEEGLVLVHTLDISSPSYTRRRLQRIRQLTALAKRRVSSSKGMTPLEGQKVCSNPSVWLK